MKSKKVTYKGKEYPSLSELARHKKINKYTLSWRLNKIGMSIDEAVEKGPAPTKNYTINGITYQSLREVAEAEGISYNNLKRIAYKAGGDPEKLELIIAQMQRVVQDHKGNKFKSYSEMARIYGIKTTTFLSRLNNGKSIEEALTCPVRPLSPRRNKA